MVALALSRIGGLLVCLIASYLLDDLFERHREAGRFSAPKIIFSAGRGFTLVELALVVAIMGILTAVAIPCYSHYVEKARVANVIIDMCSLENDITAYYELTGQYPDSMAEIGDGNSVDRWGNQYQYHRITGPNDGLARKDRYLHPINTDYDLYSMGADGKSALPLTAKASQDDIIRANNGQFAGIASDY